MKIHHLTCGCLCPTGGYLIDGFSPTLGGCLLSCHCLLIETAGSGLVLVDTGLGTQDLRRPGFRKASLLKALSRSKISPERTALGQVQSLGFDARDVRHIVVTHLGFDHAGGIADFPEARIHVMAAEKAASESRRGWRDRQRYIPISSRGNLNWRSYAVQGGSWFGFDAVTELDGLPPEILLVPLAGHTLGHAGVAVHTGSEWLLHAGDAYFHRDEMDVRKPRCSPGLSVFQWLMDSHRTWRLRNQERLRELVRSHGGQVHVFCAHDYQEFKALQSLEKGTARAGSSRAA